MVRRRRLSPEEEDLWNSVARTARALHPSQPRPPEADTLKPQTTVQPSIPRLSPFALGEKVQRSERRNLGSGPTEVLKNAGLQMDAKTHGKMTRGKLQPEARIDLHGMTLSEAQPELIRFILNAHAQGLRLVLVITGKGKRRDDGGPIPQRVGALRHQVPGWLHLPPLAPVVLQVTEAHQRHGGSGANYVYLRRRHAGP
jgi:DNA-nicking Smr family endonuclease